MTRAPSTSGAVRLKMADHVLVVVLDRPTAANARNQAMRADLAATWAWVEQSPEVRVVVLTGAGERHFCAGMDLKEAGDPDETIEERRTRMQSSRDVEQLAALPVPTVAAINGAALGGGFEMALACDLRIAGDNARLGLPEVTHGLMPGAGGTYRLPRLVGVGRALELMLLGRAIDAATAEDMGIVNRVVPSDEVGEVAIKFAREIANHDLGATVAIKRTVMEGLHRDDAANAEMELGGLLTLLEARDARGRR